MAFDLDNEELKATRKLHNQDDGLYEDKSDKNVANIEDDIKTLIEENPSHKKEQAIEHILSEREQDKKRIQELEEENRIFALEGSKVRLELYIKENYIPIQVVKDKIKEIKRLRDKCITTEGYNIANGEVVVLQELLEGERK